MVRSNGCQKPLGNSDWKTRCGTAGARNKVPDTFFPTPFSPEMTFEMKDSMADKSAEVVQTRPGQHAFIRQLHQALFSVNVGLAGEDLVCRYWHGLQARFFRIELLILLRWDTIHGRRVYRDFTNGYISFWLP